ncbi:alpha/beta hydrolase [Streptomyces sp. URMC 123]|uniref:alpha/beta hydrolase n=1 Tax=Streptomyces sp. URMC 123 TaxID=3423403 RepID=UPI003F1C4E46
MRVSDLRDLKRSAYETAAEGWRKVSHQAGADMDFVDQTMLGKLGKQEGETKNAAVGAVNMLSQNYQYIQMQTGLVRTALTGLAQELRAPQQALKKALSEAQENGLTVHDDGSVTYPAATSHGKEFPGGTARGDGEAPKGGFEGLAQQSVSMEDALRAQSDYAYERAGQPKVNPKKHLAERLAREIADALRIAGEVDTEYSRALSKLAARIGGVKVTPDMWADAETDRAEVFKAAGDVYEAKNIPKGKSPKENAAWWNGLSKEQQDAYVSLHPASVGALDGLPAEVRDTANRTVLREEHAELLATLARHKEKEPKGGRPKTVQHKEAVTITSKDWDAWDAERKRLEARIGGIEAIQGRFDRTYDENVEKDKLPPAYLLGFDSEGRGRAIVANGNPDTADHTAVYVPGTGSQLSKAKGDINRMVELWQEATVLDTTKKQQVSTITWIGYDAPEDIVKDATRDKYADNGAPAYNRFLDGLNTANKAGSDSHLTALGHSYGSTLIGSAARQGDLNADDIVVAGSPGMQVGRATDLDVPKGHVWNEEADGDPVPDLGAFFHGGSQWRIGGGAGIAPSQDIFGAEQMATDTEGHSGYWDEDSESLKNQAKVVMGQYESVTRK